MKGKKQQRGDGTGREEKKRDIRKMRASEEIKTAGFSVCMLFVSQCSA